MSSINSEHYPWLTNTYFKGIIQSNEDHFVNIRVINFELHDAVAKGENYGSQMIRAVVSYCVGDASDVLQKSYIIKTVLRIEIQEIIDLSPLFAKEVAFYRDILPKLMKYTQSFDETFKFAPKCYDVNEKPLYFVLEDLTRDGYRNMDRHIGLNIHATEMVLKKVARYHAMGAKLLCAENTTNLFDVHKIKVVNSEDVQLVNIFMCGLKDCQELSRNWPGYEHLSSKLEQLNKIFVYKAQKVFETDDSEFNVVTHGDLWVNNIMFKFDETNKPIDVIMVDFQIGFIGSPAIDLTYLLYTSTTNEMGEKEWDRLLQVYHVELVNTLKAINYTKHIPTLTELQIAMLKRSLYAVMTSLTNIGPRHMDKTEHADLDLLLFDNENAKLMRHEVYDKPEAKERILYLLDYYERKGFLEID